MAILLAPGLVNSPVANADNTVQPTADIVSALTLKRHSPVISAPLLQCEDQNGVVLASINADGSFTLPAFQAFATNAGTVPFQIGYNVVPAPTHVICFFTAPDNANNTAFELDFLANGQLFWWRQTSDPTDLEEIGQIIPEWASNAVGAQKGRLRMVAADASAEREFLRGESTGTAPAVGFLGAAAVVQQVNASQATINAITDANAKAACQAFYNAFKSFGLCAATA